MDGRREKVVCHLHIVTGMGSRALTYLFTYLQQRWAGVSTLDPAMSGEVNNPLISRRVVSGFWDHTHLSYR